MGFASSICRKAVAKAEEAAAIGALMFIAGAVLLSFFFYGKNTKQPPKGVNP